jgi:magnesium chelatase subunit D
VITNDYDILPLLRLVAPVEQIQVVCQQNCGARIGESAVISKKMHFYNPRQPQAIKIVQNIDAGQLFYHQRQGGMIFHIDIFHQCGQVNHHAVATALQEAI